MLHKFTYFEPIHMHSFIFFTILSIIIISIPFFMKKDYKGIFTKALGFFILFAKVFDIWYRIAIEKEDWIFTIPLNLCNISAIVIGIFLIIRRNTLFNLAYFWFTGAILAVILPGIVTYRTPFYIYVFMGLHFLEIMAVIYAFIHLDVRVTKKGLYFALIGYLTLCLVGSIVNYLTGTNYMFTYDYIIPAVNFIEPFILYVVLLISLFMLSMILTYLPFLHIDNEEIEEKSIS